MNDVVVLLFNGVSVSIHPDEANRELKARVIDMSHVLMVDRWRHRTSAMLDLVRVGS